MNKALVTGGCGFLGSWIVRQLVDAGAKVRVLALPGESRDNIADVEVEVVEGNVLRTDDCLSACTGCDTVFHAAAIYADWAPDPTLLYNVNLRGTFNMMEAARRSDVERVIYTASMVSIGRPEHGQLGDESTPFESWRIDFPYARSKFFSREIADYFADWGMDVRVVCPGVVLGPNDIRPTPSGKLIINSLSGTTGVYWDGGASYVDVRDAARVHLLAAQKGTAGQRYLATAHNLSTKDLVLTIDRVTGRKRRVIKLPVAVARAVARAMEARALKTGKPPMLARDMFEYTLRASYYDNRKSKDELGATYRPVEQTIEDAVDYFRGRGMVR